MRIKELIYIVSVLYLGGKGYLYLVPIKINHIFRNYYFDVLAPVILIPCFAYLQKIIIYRKMEKILINEIIAYILVLSLLFEFYFPSIVHKGTGDFIDVLCYIIGGIILLILRVEV
jgi:hypothetical protein